MPKKQKQTKIKLIANPGSGPVEGSHVLEQVFRLLESQGFKPDVAVARPNEEAVPIARKAVKDGYRLVVVMGGDDAVWAVMRGLAGSKVRLGIVPTGTENNVARSLGIPEEPEGACALIASRPTRKVDLGEVKRKGGKKTIFFEVVTVGLAAALYPDVKKVPKGDLSRVKDAVTTILTHPPKPKVYLTLDGESKVRVETMLATVANLPIMGAHFLVAPDASVDDGLLDVALYPEFSKPQLAAYFAQVREEGTADESKVQRFRARKISIKTSPKMPVLADGTMLGKGAVKIRVRRRALRIIAPQPGAGVEEPRKEAVEKLPAPVAPAADGDASQSVSAGQKGQDGSSA